MSYQCVLFEHREGVARLTLNRPERLNSFNVQMHEEVGHVLREVEQDERCRVLVLSGAGRGFCAGEDRKESLQRGVPGGQRPAIEDPFMSGAREKRTELTAHQA